ncbi:hypothetical protein CRG98_004562 [Punica granatum]|uniref:Small EDRK-rich factor-like N-terminal domain-containing protein n=1 Tax=Punica granatum TaxID=22663 RepID=A0A2I0L318_PUNGR|nr:hypothetical protein CRG98_004562 [Punica granatum]
MDVFQDFGTEPYHVKSWSQNLPGTCIIPQVPGIPDIRAHLKEHGGMKMMRICSVRVRIFCGGSLVSFLDCCWGSISRGSQRERDRERAQARGGKKGNTKDDGLTPEQRRERDAKALQEKAAKKAAEAAAGGDAGGKMEMKKGVEGTLAVATPRPKSRRK